MNILICNAGSTSLKLKLFRMPEEDHFERTFRDRKETWTYRADRNAEGKLGVFVPEADLGQLP